MSQIGDYTPSIKVDSAAESTPITNSVNASIPPSSADGEVGLFTSDLVSPTVAASLPETYTIRSLRKSDYAKGFLDVLRVLTTVGDIAEEQWNERYDWMNTQGKGSYYVLCVLDGERVVGTGALIVERKLYDVLPFTHCPLATVY
jgi:glucosamine-phosphate N-acetyltransferase